MSGKVDILTRLRLEDLASRTLDAIRKSFSGVDDERKHAQSGFAEFSRSVASVAIGSMIQPAIASVKEYARSFVDASEAADRNRQTIAALVAANNNLGANAALEYAEDRMDRLNDAALNAHASISSVREAFGVLLEIQGASTKNMPEAEANLERMAVIANKLGMDAGSVAREFGFMEEGALKMKGHLFQLLQSTGIFGKNTKQASEYWSKLTDKSRHDLLNYGLEQMSKRMEGFPPTMHELLTNLDNIWTTVKEQLGEPLVAALMPELDSLVHELMAGEQGMSKFAQGLGREVGAWVRDAAKDVREGFKYLKDHHQEIAESIHKAFENARAVVAWILSHKEEIAVAFGAKAALPALQAGGQGLGALMQLQSKGGGPLSAGTGGALGGAAVVASFAAAVTAWGLAIDQWRDLMHLTGGGKSDARMAQDARREELARMVAAPQLGAMSPEALKRFEELRKAYVAGAKDLDDDARAAGDLADNAWSAHRAVRSKLEVFDRMRDVFKRLEATGGATQGSDFGKAVETIDQGFGEALKAHNEGMERYVANVLGGSATLQKAFLNSSSMTSEGFLALADLLKDSSKDFADKLKALAAKEGGGEKAKAPVAVFTGPITVKQDFRQQDPDRVAVAFKRGLAKEAEVRVQSTWTSPFGT